MPLLPRRPRAPCGLRGPCGCGSDDRLHGDDDDLRPALFHQGAVGPLLHHLAVDAADWDELADLRQPRNERGVLDDAAIDILEANPVAISALGHRPSECVAGWQVAGCRLSRL